MYPKKSQQGCLLLAGASRSPTCTVWVRVWHRPYEIHTIICIYICVYIYTSIWTILSTSSTAQGSGGSFKDRKLYLLVVTPNTLLKQEGLQLAEASFPYVMMSCLYILQEYHDNMSARVMLTRCKPSTNVQARPRSTSTVVAFCLEISLPASDAFNIF